MTFLYPLGLLGLIGIPILIIIYIIKNKYTEQTIASTYLWILSEKFLKRKNPIKKIVGLISLILQILIVAVLSFGMAHPIIILPDAANEYCFILDASGSMNMVNGKTSRFERGKDEIENIIKGSLDGSYYSLIYVSDYTTVVYEREEDKEVAVDKLLELEAGYSVGKMDDAIATAQTYFNDNHSLKTYLVTDKAYESTANVEVVNVSNGEKNYAVTNLAHTLAGNRLTVTGEVVSYEKDMELTVELYVDGQAEAIATQKVLTQALAFTPFTFECDLAVEYFDKLTVKIAEKDSLDLDNSSTLFNVKNENSYQTLLVSNEPFYISSAIKTAGNAKLTVWSEEEYSTQYSKGKANGFGLYIFDSITPNELPQDGAVWFFNINGNVEGSGFTVQSEVEVENGAKVEMSTSSATLVKKLTEYIIADDFYVSHYLKCGLYRNFTTLFSYKGNPIVFTGNNDYGNREVVFAFNLSNSSSAIRSVFPILVRNLLDYSFPTVIEKVSYSVGDKLEVNVLANCTGIKVTTPSLKEDYINSNIAISDYALEEVGVYKITLTVGGSDRDYFIYSTVPEEERSPLATASEVVISGEAGGGGLDGKFDTLLVLLISLAVLFLADWGVYCYDKYQLR